MTTVVHRAVQLPQNCPIALILLKTYYKEGIFIVHPNQHTRKISYHISVLDFYAEEVVWRVFVIYVRAHFFFMYDSPPL